MGAGEISAVGLGSTANGFEGFSVETHVVDCSRRGEAGGEKEEEGGGVSMKEEEREWGENHINRRECRKLKNI